MPVKIDEHLNIEAYFDVSYAWDDNNYVWIIGYIEICAQVRVSFLT